MLCDGVWCVSVGLLCVMECQSLILHTVCSVLMLLCNVCSVLMLLHTVQCAYVSLFYVVC